MKKWYSFVIRVFFWPHHLMDLNFYNIRKTWQLGKSLHATDLGNLLPAKQCGLRRSPFLLDLLFLTEQMCKDNLSSCVYVWTRFSPTSILLTSAMSEALFLFSWVTASCIGFLCSTEGSRPGWFWPYISKIYVHNWPCIKKAEWWSLAYVHCRTEQR